MISRSNSKSAVMSGFNYLIKIIFLLESLILAQDERWRRA